MQVFPFPLPDTRKFSRDGLVNATSKRKLLDDLRLVLINVLDEVRTCSYEIMRIYCMKEAGHLSEEAQKMYIYTHKIFFKLSIVLLVRASFTSNI